MKGLALLLAGLGWLACAVSPALGQGGEQESREGRLADIERELDWLREHQADLQEARQAATGGVIYIDGFMGISFPFTQEDAVNRLTTLVLTGELATEKAVELARQVGRDSRARTEVLDRELASIPGRIARLEGEREALGGIEARIERTEQADAFFTGNWRYELSYIIRRPDGSLRLEIYDGVLTLVVERGKARGTLTNWLSEALELSGEAVFDVVYTLKLRNLGGDLIEISARAVDRESFLNSDHVIPGGAQEREGPSATAFLDGRVVVPAWDVRSGYFAAWQP